MLTQSSAILSVDDFAVLMGWLDPPYVRITQEIEDDVLSESTTDWLVSDFSVTAHFAARRHGVRHAAIATWPLDPVYPPNRSHERDWCLETGVPGESPVVGRGLAHLCFASAEVAIVPSVPEFDPIRSHHDLVYVGCLWPTHRAGPINSPVWQEGAFRVFVYPSASDIDYMAFAEALVAAGERTRSGILLSWGTATTDVPGPVGRLSAEVESCALVPGVAALAQSQAVVCHGGQNTVLGALSFGNPVAGFPIDSDERRWNLSRAAAAGAGFIIETNEMNADGLTRALLRLRDDSELRACARTLSTAINARGGADAAIAALERRYAGEPGE